MQRRKSTALWVIPVQHRADRSDWPSWPPWHRLCCPLPSAKRREWIEEAPISKSGRVGQTGAAHNDRADRRPGEVNSEALDSGLVTSHRKARSTYHFLFSHSMPHLCTAGNKPLGSALCCLAAVSHRSCFPGRRVDLDATIR